MAGNFLVPNVERKTRRAQRRWSQSRLPSGSWDPPLQCTESNVKFYLRLRSKRDLSRSALSTEESSASRARRARRFDIVSCRIVARRGVVISNDKAAAVVCAVFIIMKLKRFLLRYYPPGIILEYRHRDGRQGEKELDLLHLTAECVPVALKRATSYANRTLHTPPPLTPPLAPFRSLSARTWRCS